MHIKQLAIVVVLTFTATLTLPALAQGNNTKTAHDHKIVYAGDDQSAQTRIDSLRK